MNILEIIKNTLSGEGIKRVFFAGNNTPPPVFAFAVHFPRLTLLIDGDYETQLEQSSKVTTLTLEPNDVVFIPANSWDKPNMEKKSTALHLLFGKKHTGASLVTTGQEISADKIAIPHTLAGPEQKIIDTVLELHRTKMEFDSYNHLLTALLGCYVSRLANYNTPMTSRSNMLFQDICGHIQENFQNDISRSSIAKYYDISPNHLSRLFKTNGYMRFCDYINYVRINRAKFLLQHYNLSLNQISKRCGYNDVVYFCRIFKKITKKTPKQYQYELK